MTRKGAKLVWVENDKARARSLKRKREGLQKKVRELTILCDIFACLIIFSPNEATPVVWPSVEEARGLLDKFFALPMFEQKKKETDLESFLKEKTKKVHEKFMKSRKKNKESITDQLMMQLQNGRGINDLTLSEIDLLLSFSKDKIILCRKKLDPTVPPSEQLTITTNDAFVGGGQDVDQTGKTGEATRIINIDSLRENQSHYLIDEWFPAPIPLQPVMYQQTGNQNPNPNSYRPYQGSSSNGNPTLEMEPVYPQLMTFHGLVESASQPLQQMTNVDLGQEPTPSETTAREDNANLTSFDLNRA